MRRWKGIKKGDKIIYNKEEYIVLELLEENGLYYCKISPISNTDEILKVNINLCTI